MKKIAIVPAYNEQAAIGSVVDELKAFDPELDVLVVDDASHDATALRAREHGALVVTLPALLRAADDLARLAAAVIDLANT